MGRRKRQPDGSGKAEGQVWHVHSVRKHVESPLGLLAKALVLSRVPDSTLRARAHSCEMLAVGSDDRVIGEWKDLAPGHMTSLSRRRTSQEESLISKRLGWQSVGATSTVQKENRTNGGIIRVHMRWSLILSLEPKRFFDMWCGGGRKSARERLGRRQNYAGPSPIIIGNRAAVGRRVRRGGRPTNG